MSGSVGATLFAYYKTLAISVPTVVEALAGQASMARSDRRLRQWSQALVRRCGVTVDVAGLDLVPRDRACVYMSNHQSHFDIPLLYSIFPGTLRMVAKAELFRVPIWGRAMRNAGFIAVDRSGNRERAVLAMRACAEAMRRGVNIWLAPEGTRSADGSLGAFKKGGFLLARDVGADIVPIAISGSRAVLPKHAAWVRPGGRVGVVFGRPIATAGRDIAGPMADLRAFLLSHT